MNRNILMAASMAALALASCGKKTETVNQNGSVSDSNAMGDAMGAGAAIAISPSPGQKFANIAAASDAFEIESSKLAATSAASATTKSFAQSMIKGHTSSTTKLNAAANAASPAITPDPTLTADQLQTLEALKGKEGAAFDAAYAEAQTKAHEITLATLREYAATGEVPSLKAFATAMVPIVTAHLNMAKGL